MRLRYTTNVLIQNGKIRRSSAIGLENASNDQRIVIGQTKPLMHGWLRSMVSTNPQLENAEIWIAVKYIETSSGLRVDFKVQRLVDGQTGSS